jgi:ribonuclease-3
MAFNNLLQTLNWQGSPARLHEALTHRSAAAPSYERLEFVGDRALNLAVAGWLFRLYPEASEGELSLLHTALVREGACAQVGEAWELWPLVQVVGQQTANSRARIVADAVEAVLGAIYLQQGMAAVQVLVERDWAPSLSAMPTQAKDAKTALQELLQAQGHQLPTYTTLQQEGPDHAAQFTVQVECTLGTTQGVGKSKQAASLAAAAALMKELIK